jgi:hypothetical protein
LARSAPVGGRDEDDAALDVEAVHLDEHLVQRLLALVVPTAHAGAAVPADGVDLVDEHDGGRVGLRLLEQVADPAGADTDEHLDEVGARDRVERDAGLTGDRTREQGLAGTGRAVQQHALRDLGADRLELGRALEELLDLVQLLDRLVGSRDVGERGLRRVLADQLGLALAELHDPAAAALHLGHEVEEQAENDQERQETDQDGDEQALPVHLHVVRDVGSLERVGELPALVGQERRLHLRLAVDGGAVLELQPDLLLAVEQLHRLLGRGADVAVLDRGEHRRGLDLFEAAVAAEPARDREQHEHGKDQVEERPAGEALEVHRRGAVAPSLLTTAKF